MTAVSRRLVRAARSRWFVPLVLAPLVFLAINATLAAGDHLRSRDYDDWWSRSRSLERLLGTRLRGVANTPRALALERRMQPEADDPGILRLDLPRQAWDRLGSDPDTGFDTWVDGTIFERGRFLDVQCRLRGDTSVHWLTEKKSFTLKTPRDALYRGHRRLALSSKHVLLQYLTSQMAREFGLVAPENWIRPVFLNDRFLGLYRCTELVDESLTRRARRMPGNIYRGDNAERGEFYKGIDSNLFRNPHIWDRVAKNDRPDAPPPDAMAEVARALNGTDEDAMRLLSERFDREQLSRMLALLMLLGDLHHPSSIHNHHWYEDPATGRLEFIPWDLYLGAADEAPERLNLLFRTVLRDPEIVDRAFRLLAEKERTEGLVAVGRKIVDPVWERYALYFEYESLREGAISDVGRPEEALSVLERNVELLSEQFADARFRACTAVAEDETLILDLLSLGAVGADLEALTVAGTSLGPGARLVMDLDRNGRPDATDPEVAFVTDGAAMRLTRPIPLLAGNGADEFLPRASPVHYRFLLHTDGPIGSVTTLDPTLTRRTDGVRIHAVPWDTGDAIPETTALHPWDRMRAARAPDLHWQGEVRLDADLRIAEGQRLVIAPGTVVRLAADVSILVRGIVTAVGEEGAPIVFLPAVPDRPWGTLGLVGPGASGSVFRHCRFTHGGGDTLDRIEFKGMVSVHAVDGVEFVRCEFADNLRCDDSLNLVHTRGEVRECVFVRGNADGLDLDYSEGRIVDCEFVDCRNDAVDLMTSSPVIVSNRMTNCGDKGVSIGENSSPFLVGNVIDGADVGVEVKDGSQPFVAANQILRCRVAVRQAVKNWRYGDGGHAKLVANTLRENGRDLDADSRSTLTRLESPDGLPRWCLDWAGCRETEDGGFEFASTVEPLVELEFGYDPGLSLDEWESSGVLRVDDRVLSLTARERPAEAAGRLEWEVPAGGSAAVLVAEAQATGLASAELVAVGADGRHAVIDVASTERADEFRYLSVALPPGRYDGLLLRALPDGARGRLRLRSVRVFELR